MARQKHKHMHQCLHCRVKKVQCFGNCELNKYCCTCFTKLYKQTKYDYQQRRDNYATTHPTDNQSDRRSDGSKGYAEDTRLARSNSNQVPGNAQPANKVSAEDPYRVSRYDHRPKLTSIVYELFEITKGE